MVSGNDERRRQRRTRNLVGRAVGGRHADGPAAYRDDLCGADAAPGPLCLLYGRAIARPAGNHRSRAIGHRGRLDPFQKMSNRDQKLLRGFAVQRVGTARNPHCLEIRSQCGKPSRSGIRNIPAGFHFAIDQDRR